MHFRNVLLALLVISCPAAALAQQCEDVIAQYEVSRGSNEEFRVEARFDHPVSRLDVNYFPLADRPEGQAQSIVDLRAYGQSGQRVTLSYVGEGGWESAPEAPAYRITYRVRADHNDVDWSRGAPGRDEVAARFDKTYYFAGDAFFLVDFSMPRCPIDVVFNLPRSWHVTSPWPMTGRTARAMGPRNLSRNAFAMGEDATQSSNLGGVEVEWLIDDAVAPASGRIAELMTALPPTYSAFWGRRPVDRLTLFFLGDPMSDGGAFENSFAMLLATPLSAADEISWSHTLGHELQHVWMGAGAIHGVPGGEIDWFTEGFTDYLTIKLMYRAGLIDNSRLTQRIGGILRRFELARRFSPDVSLDAAGQQKLRNWELIYGGGALIALLLDADLSQSDPDGFRDMMRAVYDGASAPYDLKRLLSVLDEASGDRGSEVYAFVNGRPTFADVRARLARAGIDSAHFASDEAYVVFMPCGDDSCPPAFFAAEQDH